MSDKSLDYAAFVHLVIDALEAAGVEYLIGGAVAAWAWGEPRATADLDLVVDIPLDSVVRLSKELEKRDMLVPAEIILETILEERADIPINAIHMYSGLKADLFPMRADDELRRSAFSRRTKVDFGSQIGEVFIHSPEDLIIYKLWYYSFSGQTKHLRDIVAILNALRGELDFLYIQTWAERKGVGRVWEEIYKNQTPR